MFLPFISGCCVFIINKNRGLVWSFWITIPVKACPWYHFEQSNKKWYLSHLTCEAGNFYDIRGCLCVCTSFSWEFMPYHLSIMTWLYISYFIIPPILCFPTNALINKIKTMACFSLCSCDDDWYVQEESSTLSFPSYYIDAEVTILRQHSSSPSKQSYSSVPQSWLCGLLCFIAFTRQ